MKQTILIGCLIITVFGMPKMITAQDDSIPIINQKLEKLEGQFDLLKEKVDQQGEITEDKIENGINEIQNKFEAHKNDIHDNSVTYWITLISGALGLLGISIGLFYRLKTFIEKQAEEKVANKLQERINDLIEDNEKRLIELIKRHSTESTIKEESKIIVLSKPGASHDFLQVLFKNSGFKKVDYENYSEKTDLSPFKNFDLIFFNNNDNEKKFTSEEIESIANKTGDVALFNFGSNHLAPHLHDRFASARFKSQILGNLLNALITRKALRKSN